MSTAQEGRRLPQCERGTVTERPRLAGPCVERHWPFGVSQVRTDEAATRKPNQSYANKAHSA